LKREGYKGDFALYFPWSKSMRYMGGDEDDRGKNGGGNTLNRKNED